MKFETLDPVWSHVVGAVGMHMVFYTLITKVMGGGGKHPRFSQEQHITQTHNKL